MEKIKKMGKTKKRRYTLFFLFSFFFFPPSNFHLVSFPIKQKEKPGNAQLATEVVGGIRLNLIDYAGATEKPTNEVKGE